MVPWRWGVCVSPLGWKWSLTPPHTLKTGVSGGIFGMVLASPGTAVCQPKYTDCRQSKRTRLRWSGLSLIPSRHDAPAWAPKDFRDLGWWGMRSYDWTLKTWGDETLSILFYVCKVAEGGSVLEKWGSEKGGLGWMLTEWMWQMKTSWEGDKARGVFLPKEVGVCCMGDPGWVEESWTGIWGGGWGGEKGQSCVSGTLTD